VQENKFKNEMQESIQKARENEAHRLSAYQDELEESLKIMLAKYV